MSDNTAFAAIVIALIVAIAVLNGFKAWLDRRPDHSGELTQLRTENSVLKETVREAARQHVRDQLGQTPVTAGRQ